MAKGTSRHAGSIEMTSGSLWKNIFLLSIPLMFSQLLEVLFNLSDVAVVGKFSSYLALGSVGSTTMLVTLFTGFLIGLGGGVNVTVARALGARNAEEAQDTIHSSFLICTIAGVIVCLVCNLFAAPMLRLLHTRDELLDGAIVYLRIYSLGMPAMAIYNFGNGVMSAAGDTRRPLIYLTISGVLNVLLNLFFVICCHMAADGVAVASAISQCLSALLIVLHLLRRTDPCHLSFRRLRFHRAACQRVLLTGIPSGLQNAIFAIANMFVQAGVNSFDAVTVSGSSAAANADTLVFNMMAAFHTVCASFVSQNWGAGRYDRIRKSYHISMLYSFLVGGVFGIAMLLFGRQFLLLFTSEPAVIDAGMQRLKIMSFSYAISAFMDCTIAASRGIGRSVAPTIIVILGSCVFRVVWVYTVFAYFHTISSLYLLYFFSWIITAAAEIIYFRASYRKGILPAVQSSGA